MPSARDSRPATRAWIPRKARPRAAIATSRWPAASRSAHPSARSAGAKPMSEVLKPVPDLAQRERALDPTASFIVQAPAGSGKTELLIQRFLALLARVERPEKIAAISFTIRAAAEMRGRIFAALRSARREPCPATPHEARTWELARAALERNDALDWKLEESADRLRVQTIDALCAS